MPNRPRDVGPRIPAALAREALEPVFDRSVKWNGTGLAAAVGVNFQTFWRWFDDRSLDVRMARQIALVLLGWGADLSARGARLLALAEEHDVLPDAPLPPAFDAVGFARRLRNLQLEADALAGAAAGAESPTPVVTPAAPHALADTQLIGVGAPDRPADGP